MPVPTKGRRMGGSPAHQRLIIANLATQLFENDKIKTTEAKAKKLRPHAERLITIAKGGDLASIRRVARTITDKGVANKLVTEIAPAMKDREGGYTRIIKIGPRQGDNAPMAVIELVQEPVQKKTKKKQAAASASADSTKKDKSAASKNESSKEEAIDSTSEVDTDATDADSVAAQDNSADSTSENTDKSGDS